MRTQPPAEPFLGDRAFWVRYLSAGVDLRGCPALEADRRQLAGDQLPDLSLAFALPRQFGLTIQVRGWVHRLELTHPSLPSPAPLGWMDCQHMSDVFQRDEFEALVRCL